MNIGMRSRGTRGQWNTMIEAAYATKMTQAAIVNAMCITKGRVVSEQNRAKLDALIAPKKQTNAQKNIARLAAALK